MISMIIIMIFIRVMIMMNMRIMMILILKLMTLGWELKWMVCKKEDDKC